MAINSNQLHVAKIYPGNYTNVLRYWHETKTIQYQNANGVDTNLTGQPVGGPVGVVFQPGWIAQQAVGYVDLSHQALGTNNQLAYYTKPYGSGQNSAEQPSSTPMSSFRPRLPQGRPGRHRRHQSSCYRLRLPRFPA